MQEDAREEREWEQSAGRKHPDDGIRNRLKALFAASDDHDGVDALITDRGREIVEQTERLQVTIENLEQREEQAARLRASVEEMLRHGSAELDERQAALTALALSLGAREQKLREQEEELALRRQELGAVELRRAAVERREEAAAQREAFLGRDRAVADPRGSDATTNEPDPATGHILVLADAGWRIVEREGLAPALDSPVEVDGRSYVVSRVGRSALPDDRRACVYLELARNSPAG